MSGSTAMVGMVPSVVGFDVVSAVAGVVVIAIFGVVDMVENRTCCGQMKSEDDGEASESERAGAKVGTRCIFTDIITG